MNLSNFLSSFKLSALWARNKSHVDIFFVKTCIVHIKNIYAQEQCIRAFFWGPKTRSLGLSLWSECSNCLHSHLYFRTSDETQQHYNAFTLCTDLHGALLVRGTPTFCQQLTYCRKENVADVIQVSRIGLVLYLRMFLGFFWGFFFSRATDHVTETGVNK